MAKKVITVLKLQQCNTCGVIVGDRNLHKSTAHNSSFSEYRVAIKIDEHLLFREKETVEVEDEYDRTNAD